MKYMVMTFGEAATMMEVASPEWIREMVAFMKTLNADLENAGELVDAQGLTDGRTAKTVRIKDDAPVATDGPFAEAKESLVGYWVVDVASEDRAIQIASRIVEFVRQPIEVRQVAEAPPEV